MTTPEERDHRLALLRRDLHDHIADASPEELGILVEQLSLALEQRVGTYAPFIQHAVKGIHDTLEKARRARPEAPAR